MQPSLFVKSLLIVPISGFVVGAAVGYVAARLQTHFAPVGLYPLLVGAALGLLTAGTLLACGLRQRRAAVLGAAVATAACLATVHGVSYLAARAAADNEIATHHQMLAAFPGAVQTPHPPSLGDFGEYVRRELDVGRKLGPHSVGGAGLILWWVLDGAAVLIAALTAALLTQSYVVPSATTAEQRVAEDLAT